MQIGPEYGYYPDPPKTWLIVKEDSFSQANQNFQGSGTSITKEGKRLLGAVTLCCALLRHNGFTVDVEVSVRSVIVDEDLGK